jgi:hypothetical protein
MSIGLEDVIAAWIAAFQHGSKGVEDDRDDVHERAHRNGRGALREAAQETPNGPATWTQS